MAPLVQQPNMGERVLARNLSWQQKNAALPLLQRVVIVLGDAWLCVYACEHVSAGGDKGIHHSRSSSSTNSRIPTASKNENALPTQ